LPGEAARAGLESTRRAVVDLARHTRLIVDYAGNLRKTLEEFDVVTTDAWANFSERARESMRRFGLDPVDGSEDEVARTVAASRIRDVLLGLLVEWRRGADVATRYPRKDPGGPAVAAGSPVTAERLDRVVRSARRRCGGAYARWQDLLDHNDVPGLVAFAASPDGLGFRSGLVAALGWDLFRAKEYRACQAYLRAAVDRYAQDDWLRVELAFACTMVVPPDHAEALRHHSAASALRPDSASLLSMVGKAYADLGAYDQAIAACRKAIAMSPSSTGSSYFVMGQALTRKKDWEAAIAALRASIRLLPEQGARLLVPEAYFALGVALEEAGRHAEALQETVTALQQDPTLAENPHYPFRYNAACLAMSCTDGKGINTPAPAERTAYRKQALDLLTADLAWIQKRAAVDRAFAQRRMQWWLGDADLASVRDPTALEKLPLDEREAWRKLWADVRELRDRSAPQADPLHTSK
jgi:tetratricopeptide (TPR) repeat protein